MNVRVRLTGATEDTIWLEDGQLFYELEYNQGWVSVFCYGKNVHAPKDLLWVEHFCIQSVQRAKAWRGQPPQWKG